MAFVPKSWQNTPSTSTPLSAAGLQDLETRVTNIGLGGLVSKVANYTAVAGDVVYSNPATGGATITLPAAAASTSVTVMAGVAATGANQTTISFGSANIFGLGLSTSGVSSFTLGTPLACVTLTSDGTHWYIVSGLADTGWINATTQGGGLATSFAQNSGNNLFFRQLGARVYAKGELSYSGAGTSGGVVPTLPTPISGTPSSLNAFAPWAIFSSGWTLQLARITSNIAVGDGFTIPNGAVLDFQSVTWSTS